MAIVVLPAAAAAAVEEMCEVEAPACAADELAIDAREVRASGVRARNEVRKEAACRERLRDELSEGQCGEEART